MVSLYRLRNLQSPEPGHNNMKAYAGVMGSYCSEIDISFPSDSEHPGQWCHQKNAWFQPIERTDLRLIHLHEHVEDTAHVELLLPARQSRR